MSNMIKLALQYYNGEISAETLEWDYLKFWRKEHPNADENIAMAEWDIWGFCEAYSADTPDDNTLNYPINEKQLRQKIETVLKRIGVIS